MYRGRPTNARESHRVDRAPLSAPKPSPKEILVFQSASRRDFLKQVSAAGSILALSASGRIAFAREDHAKLNILILGGTGLIGPALIDSAKARGHKVTLFNRGKTRADLYPEIEKLRGDRDPKKGEGLKALEGKQFDVVFDDCGYFPRIVTASAELLAPNISQYVYVSSISCYADNSKEGQDEDAACGKMDDPTLETMGDQFQYYGPLKALCEAAAEKACPGKTTIIRPGYIVGPEDWTGRFTYWPWRIAKGGEVLVPGNPDDPIQIIDVRDLADFMVHCAEQKTMGKFNLCGPGQRLTMKQMVADCQKAVGGDAKLTWVPTDFLTKNGLGGDGGFPIWAPFEGETKGFHTWKNERAVKAGLKFHSVEDTAKATMEWFNARPEAEQNQMIKRSGAMSLDREAELLEAWHKSQEGKG